MNSYRLLLLAFVVALIWMSADAVQSVKRLTLEPGLMVRMSAGLPAQEFLVLVDTVHGSSWLVGEHCEDEFCRRQRRFNRSLSSTNTRDGRFWRADFGFGAVVEGELCKDRIGFTSNDELVIEGQLIGEVNKAQGWILDYIELDGVIGLGSSQRVSLVALDPVQNMYRQGLIPQELFALHLAKDNSKDELVGELVVGGLDVGHFSGEITHVNIINRWSFYMDYVSVPGSDMLYSGRGRAQIDTSCNVILAPPAPFNAIMNLFATKLDSRFGLPLFESCNNIPDRHLELFVNGTKLSLSTRDLIMRVETGGKSTCYLALKMNVEISWILGTPFLHKYYTIFDYSNKRLGFALSL